MSETNSSAPVEPEQAKVSDYQDAQKVLRQTILKIHNDPELSATEKARKIQVLVLIWYFYLFIVLVGINDSRPITTGPGLPQAQQSY